MAGSTYKFHLLPSGLVHPKTTCVIGNGVVIHLPSFFNEIDSITAPADGGKPLEVGLSACSACCRAWLLPQGQQGLWAGLRRSVLEAKRGEEVVVAAGLTWAACATGGGSDFSVEPRAPRA